MAKLLGCGRWVGG